MKQKILTVHPGDNITVALETLQAGEQVDIGGKALVIRDKIRQKHKFNTTELQQGDDVIMYGVTVGKAIETIPVGSLISQANVTHKAGSYKIEPAKIDWTPPPVEKLTRTTWNGYHRDNGSIGTRNYWIVVPLVFCENRNIDVIRESLVHQLGYLSERDYKVDIESLVLKYRNGASRSELLETNVLETRESAVKKRLFENVDGIKFLSHEGGCGGTRDDVQALCNLLAGYITHPNVGGATVLSLGCQMAQIDMLRQAIRERDPGFSKPLEIFNQQSSPSEREMIARAVKATFVGLAKINEITRQPASADALCLGLECGGSDGFSGISANPALGYASDIIVALGGKAILSEFPELNGVEQNLLNRCVDMAIAEKFAHLMSAYSGAAQRVGSGFDMNPSPGNIKDGLITDAMKSAGAAKKGGTSPVADVLDYTEPARKAGLHLLCTPGNDVESTTGLAGSGANIIAFTTGLGTPTGNPVAPTVKISSNSELAQNMPDLIDVDAGPVITGDKTIEEMGIEIFNFLLCVASGETETKSEKLGQDDFIPWKRGISL